MGLMMTIMMRKKRRMDRTRSDFDQCLGFIRFALPCLVLGRAVRMGTSIAHDAISHSKFWPR
jgi:hypothetical protein